MINAYLTDDITVKITTYGTWGGATESSSTIKGRIDFRTKMMRNLQGEQVVSSAKVYLPIMFLNHKDKIVYDGHEYSIINIREVKDFSKRFLQVDLV